ncbi:transcriptional regulator GcvA [Dechloromonas hortensis]|uniref:transcriptional regulator GcvA n=1 Tax=Dechloromonas hortensis TaxID=337779 RepID=UPI0012923867|nr:transcriptional regulator GcvA [Dechloromonas hortensis]
MTYRLPPLSAMRAFEAASRHLSFKKAAEELHVTPAAISQQIKTLEEYLGVSLFRRLTRALEITAEGSAMLPKVREGFECFASAVDSTRRPGDGVLTILAPPSFAARWLVPRLPRFAAACPEVKLRLSSSGDAVDRRGEKRELEGEPVDLRAASSALAIRYGTGNYPGFRVEQILSPDWVPVCSPRLLEFGPSLKVPEDLARHVLIHDETIEDEERQPSWREWLASAGVRGVDAQRGPRFSNALLAVEAALEAQGVALALKPLVEADVAAGRLVVPFEISVPSPYAYYLVMRKAVAERDSVAAFRHWLLGEVQAFGGIRGSRMDEAAVDGSEGV